jgi:taurine dioxygenase
MSLLRESSKSVNNIDIQPIAGRIGAVVKGIHLSGNLDSESIHFIKEALLKYKVIFFRVQHHLDDQEQEAFAKLFGEPVSHPTVPVKENTNYLLDQILQKVVEQILGIQMLLSHKPIRKLRFYEL